MNKVLIIAEAGVNHNGRLDLAIKLIDKAVEAGVDIVKFQTFKSEKIVSKFAKKADYQNQTTGCVESQFEMIKKLELSFEEFIKVKEYCDKVGIKFLSTPFDSESIDFLYDIGMDIWKIPSGEITNLPYLRKISTLAKNVIMSTGMCEVFEVEEAIKVLKKGTVEKITILHCNTEYPTPMKDVNLNAMLTLEKELGVEIGYSDHTLGIEVPIAAVALGARVIEKHFTLNKNMSGPDHRASLEPQELKEMVVAIRNIEIALGSSEKIVTESEIKNKNIARKSIVAARKIRKGDIFTEENISVKRPGDGISPMKWDDVIGKKAIKDFQEDELIQL